MTWVDPQSEARGYLATPNSPNESNRASADCIVRPRLAAVPLNGHNPRRICFHADCRGITFLSVFREAEQLVVPAIVDCMLLPFTKISRLGNTNQHNFGRGRPERSPMPPAVQRLYEVCRETFSLAGAAPPPRAVHRLRCLLDNIKPVDVGLHEDALEQDHGYGFPGPNTWGGQHAEVVAQWAAAITYLHIYECDDFSMGIFCLPTSAVIPLHNHPGMTVFSKLLFGSMHIKAYDWVNPVNTEQNAYQSPLRLAKLKVDTVFSAPSTTSILYPTTGGNIHSFQAVTSCAVLDVLGPPYSDIAGRHCTYYRDYSCWSLPEDDNTIPDDDYRGFAWLEEIERPSNFFVTGAPYHGPRVDA